MHTATLSVEANWGNKSNLEKTIDSDLTENKRMENAKMPMRARIMAKTSKPSGPPSTIAKSPGTAYHHQNPTHIRVYNPICTTPTKEPQSPESKNLPPGFKTQKQNNLTSELGRKPWQIEGVENLQLSNGV
jgi:hypothetical protein